MSWMRSCYHHMLEVLFDNIAFNNDEQSNEQTPGPQPPEKKATLSDTLKEMYTESSQKGRLASETGYLPSTITAALNDV